MTLSDTATPGQSVPRGDDNEGVLVFPKGPALLEPHHHCLTSYLGHPLVCVGESYPSAETQLVYSTTQANWIDMLLGGIGGSSPISI